MDETTEPEPQQPEPEEPRFRHWVHRDDLVAKMDQVADEIMPGASASKTDAPLYFGNDDALLDYVQRVLEALSIGVES